MARLARVVIPGHPHHVTQRGNGRARVFFGDADDALYRDLLAERCRAADVEVWAWCLMPNHVHLILVPSDADRLPRALAAVHRRYADIIHGRHRPGGSRRAGQSARSRTPLPKQAICAYFARQFPGRPGMSFNPRGLQ